MFFHVRMHDYPVPRRAAEVRTRHREYLEQHAARLIARGAKYVVPETIEASLQLSELVLIGAGVPDDAARHLIEARRQAEQAALDAS